MEWQVAVILDTNPELPDINTLVRYMPVWAIESQERRDNARALRASAAELHGPDAFTLFTSSGIADPLKLLEHVLETVLLHHPNTACLILFGVTESSALARALLIYGFVPAVGSSWGGLNFRKPIGELSNVRELTLDVKTWKTSEDVWNSLFAAVGAPPWHGKNFNALEDSIVTGGINQIEVPYSMTVMNMSRVGREAVDVANQLVAFIREKEAQGCPISVVTQN